MRSKIKVNGKFYRPVPWMLGDECDGCFFEHEGCINVESNNSPCDDGNEFTGKILIPATKKAMAEYVAKKLGADDDKSELAG